MPEKIEFLPQLMVIIHGRPYRAMAMPIADDPDGGDVASGEVLLVQAGRMHRMVLVAMSPMTVTEAPTLDDDTIPGDDDIPAPRPSVVRDAAEFTKPLTTE